VYHLYGLEYGGTPLNYLGRLHKVGHGGQILISDLTASLLRDQLPGKWELIDLGDFVLKDFLAARSSKPFIRTCRGLPPLSALRPIDGRAAPDNVFAGRAHELAAVRSLSRRGSPPSPGAGIGKTRLAFELAEVRDDYRDGVCIVELAGVQADAQVPAAVAARSTSTPSSGR
jgi:hypothetical protein